jgi:hypothetical protein
MVFFDFPHFPWREDSGEWTALTHPHRTLISGNEEPGDFSDGRALQ